MISSTDRLTARRIEAGHAQAAIASLPQVAVERMAGGSAIFHWIESPATQAIGVGMSGPVTPAELDRLEAFFWDRGSPALIDLCTLADASLLGMVAERGYVVREFSNVLARRIAPGDDFGGASAGLEVEAVSAEEIPEWGHLMIRGFSGQDDVPEEQVKMVAAASAAVQGFFGLRDGSRCAAAGMAVHEGAATLFGDATVVAGRRFGLQLALIRHRLRRAVELGCDLATASVEPGGISHRNYERAGFQLAYARVKVSRASPENSI